MLLLGHTGWPRGQRWPVMNPRPDSPFLVEHSTAGGGELGLSLHIYCAQYQLWSITNSFIMWYLRNFTLFRQQKTTVQNG